VYDNLLLVLGQDEKELSLATLNLESNLALFFLENHPDRPELA